MTIKGTHSIAIAALVFSAACTPSQQKTADERTAQAETKLEHAGEVAKRDAAQAGVKLDRATLLARVKGALAMDAGLRSVQTVDVDVSGDTVTLRGHVNSVAEKEEVERAASRVDGVSHVVNDVAVQ